MNQPSEEILDLVNEHDEVIGSMPRSEVYAKQLKNFRVINCFIRNSDGKLWIPRRQSHKKIFPNALDVSCGGHVSSVETYEEAFAKEMSEELNMNIANYPYKVLGTMNPYTDSVAAFMTVYEIQSDDAPDYNHDDFSEYYWLTPEEVMKRLENGDTSKSDLPPLLKKFYL
jgi:isopentenyl-diphosphate delta-isomerase